MRRTAGVAALLASVAVAAPAAAAAAVPSVRADTLATVTTTALTFTVTTGSGATTRICTIDGDLRVPSTASTASPAPSILMTNGFGGSKSDTGANGNGSYAERFAELGYVTLSYSGIGFGASNSCDISIDDPAIDGQAASQLVSFLGGAPGIAGTSAGTPYAIPGLVVHDPLDHDGRAQTYDPRVGMLGGSYGGEIQFAVAGIDHRVDAIAPTYTWNQLGYSLAPNNARAVDARAPVTGVSKYEWESLFFGLGAASAADPRVPSTCPGQRPDICQAEIDAATQGYFSPASQAFTDSVSVGNYIGAIKIPVLLSQGQNDTLFDLQEAIANYRALARLDPSPVRMVWQSWGHSGGTPVPGELDTGTLAAGTGALSQTYQGKIIIDWMAHWLRDAPTDLGPAVRYFRDYAYTAPAATASVADQLAAATAAYASAPSYAVGADVPLTLSGGSALVPAGTPAAAGSQTFAQPGGQAGTSYSETSAVGAEAPQTDSAGTFAAWSTAPLASAADVAGVPVLTVRLSDPAAATAQTAGPAGQLVLFAKLYDVAPGGAQTLVHGLISPVRIADVTQPQRIELPGIVHRFDVGHSLKLVLAAGDQAYRGNVAPSTVTIADDPAAPNILTVPLVSSGGIGTGATPAPALPEAGAPGLLLLAGLGTVGGCALVRRRRRRA